MATETVLEIKLTSENRERIEHLAHQRGYEVLQDYLLALVEIDAVILSEEAELEDLDEIHTKEEVLAGLRQSLHEAITGQTRPIEELWESLKDDE
jgi:hypothetical protein